MNNTIKNNLNAIVAIDGSTPIITNNNIFDNQNNVYLASYKYDLDVTNNWWGTTNTQTISQTMYDFKNDFNLGKVNFTPILTGPNPQAVPTNAVMQFTKNVQTTPSITVEPVSILIGSPVTVYASILPSPPSSFDKFTDITVTIVHPDGTKETEGPFSYPIPTYFQQHPSLFSYSPTMVGTYTFTINFPTHYFVVSNTKYVATISLPAVLTVRAPESTPSPISTPTSTAPVSPPPELELTAQLSISVNASSTVVGSTMNIHGRLSDSNGNPIPNEIILFSYAVEDSWPEVKVGSGVTNQAGEYDIQWAPAASGTFTLKVEWNGNGNYGYTKNYATLSFLPYQNQQVFFVESNSTVTELNFNSTSFTLGFQVSGPDQTTGYVKAQIAKTLSPNFTGITVSLDGKQLEFTVSSSNDYWIIDFTYHHSTHQIIMNLLANAQGNLAPTPSVPEFPTWMVLPLLASICSVFFLVKKRKREKI